MFTLWKPISGWLSQGILTKFWLGSVNLFSKLRNRQRTAKLLESWHASKVKNTASQVGDSIKFLDSYFPADDAVWLANALQLKNRTETLHITIAMCSPAAKFGAQRVAEHSRGRPDFADYERRFSDCVQGLQQHLGTLPKVKLDIYEYLTMPQLRLCIIDDQHYFWSTFPAHTINPHNVCEYAKRSYFGGTRLNMVDGLVAHWDKVMFDSTLVWSNHQKVDSQKRLPSRRTTRSLDLRRKRSAVK